jgi:molybdopterin-guanine dinucleotide biosynthesis protein B
MHVIGIVGWSGAGKTTLIEGIIQHLTSYGTTVATIKHAHSRFDMDRPGKDSYRHREAGASQTLVISPERWALLTELKDQEPPSLAEALTLLAPTDIVLVEGYRGSDIDKIEVWRAAHGGDALFESDSHVIAVASDVDAQALPSALTDQTLLSLNDPAAAAAFICRHFNLDAAKTEVTP